MSTQPGDLPPSDTPNSSPPPPPPPGNPIPPNAPAPEPVGYASYAGGIETNQEAKTFGMLCHIAALAGFMLPFAGNIVGPLIVWVIKKDQHPFVDDQGKESINFQITVTIALAVSFVLVFVFIGILIMPLVALAALVFVIIAAVQSAQGQRYRYPVNIRFIR